MLLLLHIMKFLAFLIRGNKKNQRKTLTEYQREMLVKVGKQQFKKLQDLGLKMPIAVL